MTNRNDRTATEIADELGEPPSRVNYIIQKHRLKPASRIGIIRLFDERQIEAIKQGLYGIQVRSGNNG
jgi:hypothetical protein